MATGKKPTAAQIRARKLFAERAKAGAFKRRSSGKKVKRAARRTTSAPSPAQLAARAKFTAMVKAKAKARKTKTNSRGFSTKPPAWTKAPKKRAAKKRNPGVIKMTEAEFAKLAPKMGLKAPARSRAVSAPRPKKRKTFKKVGIFGGRGFLGLGKSVQKISRNPKGRRAMHERRKQTFLRSPILSAREKRSMAKGYRKQAKHFAKRGKLETARYAARRGREILGNPRGQHLPGLAPKYQRMYEDILQSSGSKRIAAATTMKAVKNPGFFATVRGLLGKKRAAKVGYRKTQRGRSRVAPVGYRKTQKGTRRPTAYMEARSLKHNPFGQGRKAYRRATGQKQAWGLKAIKGGGWFLQGGKFGKGSRGFASKGAALRFAKRAHPTPRVKYNPKPAQVFSEFRGKDVTRSRKLKAATGTPAQLAELGKLRELKMRGRTLRFKSGHLAADGRKKLHIVGVKLRYRGNPGGEIDVGEIYSVTYEADKPHIETGVYNYVHKFGEEGGTRPHLVLDEEGYPKIEGGSYGITSDGIID